MNKEYALWVKQNGEWVLAGFYPHRQLADQTLPNWDGDH